MSETSQQQQRVQPPQQRTDSPPSSTVDSRTSAAAAAAPAETGFSATTAWSGWIVFAAVMLVLLGAFSVIEGIVALARDTYYLVASNGLVVHVNYTAWGWVHIAIGAVAVLVGAGLMTGNLAARIGGVVIALASAVINMAFIAAYPLWSTLIIAFDVVIIYAICVHGGDFKRARA